MTGRIIHELQQRILVLDGAMGTTVHQCDCDLHRDYLGKENCTEVLLKTRPEVIRGIHELFFDAGADAVETNSFGSNRLVLAEFDLADETRELNRIACEVAHDAAARFATADERRSNDDALADQLGAAFAARSADDWAGALRAAGVPPYQ